MGWGSPPKPDPKLVALQTAEAERAKADRISLLQQQLQGQDELRSQIYGAYPVGDAGSGWGGGGGGSGGGGGGGDGGGHYNSGFGGGSGFSGRQLSV